MLSYQETEQQQNDKSSCRYWSMDEEITDTAPGLHYNIACYESFLSMSSFSTLHGIAISADRFAVYLKCEV